MKSALLVKLLGPVQLSAELVILQLGERFTRQLVAAWARTMRKFSISSSSGIAKCNKALPALEFTSSSGYIHKTS
jgi:hypothetical protein